MLNLFKGIFNLMLDILSFRYDKSALIYAIKDYLNDAR
ncbi:hypothetical protein FQV37_1410 [Psychrobacter nivimaris]|uniref:Uncharacterized protein n=1 Tax=Psychrobacter nivimaris TaxID=281738 RepID=A0A6N7BWK1_9GAMM|nr:hypothetical protein FQV37_1410 [Psychrobacter nivimaris]